MLSAQMGRSLPPAPEQGWPWQPLTPSRTPGETPPPGPPARAQLLQEAPPAGWRAHPPPAHMGGLSSPTVSHPCPIPNQEASASPLWAGERQAGLPKFWLSVTQTPEGRKGRESLLSYLIQGHSEAPPWWGGLLQSPQARKVPKVTRENRTPSAPGQAQVSRDVRPLAS